MRGYSRVRPVDRHPGRGHGRSSRCTTNGRVRKVDVRIELVGMQARHQLPVLHLQQHLGQPGDARRRLQVADVRLRRADRAELRVASCRCAKRLRQPGDLDRIAQLRARCRAPRCS